MLSEICSNKGYAVRYGGDEFVIVLENCDEKGAIAIVDQLYEKIADGFADDISMYLGKKADISDDKKVSTSVGIASATDTTHEAIKEALQKADSALYYVKRSKKGRYKVYDETDCSNNE